MELTLIPLKGVERIKRKGQPEQITVTCPSCLKRLVCTSTPTDIKEGKVTPLSLHTCENEGNPHVYMLNLDKPGHEAALFGTQGYNYTEKAQGKDAK